MVANFFTNKYDFDIINITDNKYLAFKVFRLWAGVGVSLFYNQNYRKAR